MRTYNNKEELKAEINKAFEKYISEFDDIPEALKDKRVEEVDRTPAENLAYQVGWTTLVLKWETDERNGTGKNAVGGLQMESTGRIVSVVHGYLCTVIPAGAESPIEGEYGSARCNDRCHERGGAVPAA